MPTFYLCDFILPDKSVRRISLPRIPLISEKITISDDRAYATYLIATVETLVRPDTGDCAFLLTLTAIS